MVSFGRVEAQQPHIDVLHPNVQFSLCLTDNTPATIAYTPQSTLPRIQTAEDLQGLSDEFPGILNNDPLIPDLLSEYGVVFSVNPRSRGTVETQRLRTGSLLRLPVHAGPAWDGFRAVLFFTASPTARAPYDLDVQYSASFLLCFLLVQLWADLSWDDRRRLLRHLIAHEIRHCGHRQLYRPLRPGRLRQFLQAQCCGKGRLEQQLTRIERFVRQDAPLEDDDDDGVAPERDATVESPQQEPHVCHQTSSALDMERTALQK